MAPTRAGEVRTGQAGTGSAQTSAGTGSEAGSSAQRSGPGRPRAAAVRRTTTGTDPSARDAAFSVDSDNPDSPDPGRWPVGSSLSGPLS